MRNAPKYHFTIESGSDLLADIDIWDTPVPGVFEEGHIHSYYEILVFRKGGGTHQMRSDINEVNDYAIHVLPGNNFHELKRTLHTDGFEIIFSEFFLNQLQQFDIKTDYVNYFKEPRILNLSEGEFNEFEVYFNQISINKNNKPVFYNLISLIILKIICADQQVQYVSSDNSFRRKLLTLVSTHYKDKQNLEFYASNLNMSLNTFIRHTKKAFGKSVIELQNEKIIQEVRFLLSRTEKPVKEISMDFNFTDESHFTHFFKKYVGLTPSEYRRSSLS